MYHVILEVEGGFGRLRVGSLLEFSVGILNFFVRVCTSNQECDANTEYDRENDCDKQRKFHCDKNELEYGHQNKEKCRHQS